MSDADNNRRNIVTKVPEKGLNKSRKFPQLALVKIGPLGQGANSRAILKFDFGPFNAQSSGFSLY